MAEEFVAGRMYHVDAVLAPGYRFVASSRYLRSCLGVFSGDNNGSLQLRPDDKFALRLEEFFDRTLEAFETPEVGAYHLKVFHTPDDELVLCEVASRVGGDRIPALTRATYGVDLHAAWLRQACGLPVAPPPAAPPREVHGSVSILPQGRPVRAPERPLFDWVAHYEVNEKLAPDAVAQNSTSHLCFVIVRGADLEQVEKRVLEAEAWLMDHLEEAPPGWPPGPNPRRPPRREHLAPDVAHGACPSARGPAHRPDHVHVPAAARHPADGAGPAGQPSGFPGRPVGLLWPGILARVRAARGPVRHPARADVRVRAAHRGLSAARPRPRRGRDDGAAGRGDRGHRHRRLAARPVHQPSRTREQRAPTGDAGAPLDLRERGRVLGPAVGAAVYPLGFRYILAACVVSHLLLGVRLAVRPPAEAPVAAQPESNDATSGQSGPNEASAAGRWARWQWVPLVVLGVTFWAIYSQLNVVLPIAAEELTGSTAAISVVFTLNGILMVLFQYTMLRHVFRRAAIRSLLVIGFLAFGAAYALRIAFTGWYGLLAFVLPVTLAEMLIAPSLDKQAVNASSLRRTGLALGTMSAAGALGSLLGSGLGGYLLQTLHGGSDLWLVISCLSVAAAAFCLLLPKGRTQHA